MAQKAWSAFSWPRLPSWPWYGALPVCFVLLWGLAGSRHVPHPGFFLRESRVVSVQEETAAFDAGLLAGDHIVSPRHPRMALQRHQPGTFLSLEVTRGQTQHTVSIEARSPGEWEVLRRMWQSLAGLSFLALGLYVLWRRPDGVGRLFAGGSLTWAVILHAPIAPHSEAVLTALTMIEDWAQLLLGPLILHFFLWFPRPSSTLTARKLGILYVPAVVLGIFALPFIFDRLPAAGKQSVELLAALYFLTCMVLGATRFVLSLRRTESPDERRSLRVILWGTLAAFIPTLLGVAVAGRGGAGTFHLESWSPLFLLGIPWTYAYTIVRYRALGLRTNSSREFLPTGLLIALSAACVLMLVGLDQVVNLAAHPWLLAAAASTVAGILVIFAFRLRTWTLDPDLSSRDHQVRQFDRELQTGLSQERVQQSLLENLSRLFHVSTVALYSMESEAQGFVLTGKPVGDVPQALNFPAKVSRQLWEARRLMSQRALLRECPVGLQARLSAQLEDLPYEAFIPLHYGEKSYALLALAPPADRHSFSTGERRVITRLAVRTAAALQTARIYEDAANRERLQRDLELARGIQERLLPPHPPRRLELDVSAKTLSCEAVGGDFYDFIDFPNGNFGFAVGDVSGKGISASILMATAHSFFHADATQGQRPAQVLGNLNRVLIGKHNQDRFVCLFYGVINPATGVLTYSNAGGEAPILIHGDGTWQPITEGGLVLGVMADAQYPHVSVQLDPDDRLVVFTDGVLESLMGDTDAFSDETFPGYATLATEINQGAPESRATLRRILKRSHLDTEDPPDDATVAVLRWLG